MRLDFAPDRRGVAFVAVVALYGCNGPEPTIPKGEDGAVTDSIVAAVTTPSPPANLLPMQLTTKQTMNVCKAGVATLMGRNPKTMKATRQPNGLTRIAYRRPNESKLWETDCRIDGNRFLWRGVDSFGNDGPGRWRDDPEDEVITFAINGKTVVMNERYSDGSTTSETYRF